jgi:hypothetical protein
VWDLLCARNDADLIERPDFRAQSAVHTKHLAVDYGGQGEKVEDLAAGLPHGGVAVLGLAFFVEAVDLRYLPRFVVSADECDAIGEPDVVSNGDVYVMSSLTSPSNTSKA